MAAALAVALALAAPPADDCMIALAAITQPTPKFADFPAAPEGPFKPAPVDLASHPEAREFRSQIRSDAKAGPNFAGHFTIVDWGCGSACLQWGVVNARSGAVWFEPGLSVVSVDHVADEPAPAAGANADFYNLRFRLDSRLLIVLGAPGEDEAREGAGYYLWDGKAFAPLKFIPRKDACAAGAP
jgi:hypothetical protein